MKQVYSIPILQKEWLDLYRIFPHKLICLEMIKKGWLKQRKRILFLLKELKL